MLPTIPTITYSTSTRKPIRLVYAAFVLLAFVLIASPGSAATAQPQSSQSPGSPQPPQSPNATCPPDGQCFADVPSSNPFYTYLNRIYQQDLVSGYTCGGLGEPCDPYNRPYYRPNNNVTRSQMSKFIDNARRLPQIHIEASSTDPLVYATNSSGPGISGISTSSGSGNYGVRGESTSGWGVVGISTNNYGVYGGSTSGTGVYGTSTNSIGVQGSGVLTGVVGISTNGWGVYGQSTSRTGVVGISTSHYGVGGQSTSNTGVVGISTDGRGVHGLSTSAAGVLGQSTSGPGVRGQSDSGSGVYGTSASGYAGYFEGDVYVSGHITATGGCCAGPELGTRIDDPLDPANKYLNQTSVQSPDMTTVINGNAILDNKGEAVVTVPSWFEVANRDFRYTLTAIGSPGPNLYIAQELSAVSAVSADQFKIAGGKGGGKVSWQVTGIRQDPYANAHRIPVEEDKPANEKGKYLHPTEWGQPESSGIDYEMQQQLQAEVPQAPKSKP